MVLTLTILKNMKVNGKDDIPYMKWKIIQKFETTNQICIYQIIIGHGPFKGEFNIGHNLIIYTVPSGNLT